MGNLSRQTLTLTILALGAVSPVWASDIHSVRNEINSLEHDLLATKESQISAASQLKKIKRLLSLQQKEIGLSQKRISELNTSLQDLSSQKQVLLDKIVAQKKTLRLKLRELNRLAEPKGLDASWISNIDAENQKSYFLSKMLKRDLKTVGELKRDVQQSLALELRILEEKNKLDYYVHDLQSEAALLSANESVQKEILRTNHSNRLESLQHLHALKDSERELEKMLAKAEKNKPKVESNPSADLQAALVEGGIDVGFIALRGKLPSPIDGPVLSSFGKSYNSKTKLLTFQKGITLGARVGTSVKAVSAGKVVFVGPLKNYGLIVILEHPGQYYSLYGQMGGVAAEMGADLKQGDVLGRTAGEPLYFEIRNKNVAINPMQWLLSDTLAAGVVSARR
jgi:septal ring factor EnvC (AmiA/AmiB activator)